MSLELVIESEAKNCTGDDEDLNHYYCCCNEDIALCGTDVSDEEEVDEADGLRCVVCEDLVNFICGRCGYGPSGPCACGRCEVRA